MVRLSVRDRCPIIRATELATNSARRVHATAKSTERILGQVRKHNLLTHLPKDSDCDACSAKNTVNPSRRKRPEAQVRAAEFGDSLSLDVLFLDGFGLNAERYLLTLVDDATGWLACAPLKTKRACEIAAAMREMLGQAGMAWPGQIRTDEGTEFHPDLEHVAQLLRIKVTKAVPGKKNHLARHERANRTIDDGIRVLLKQASLPTVFATFAARAFCQGYNHSGKPLRQQLRNCFVLALNSETSNMRVACAKYIHKGWL